MDQKTARELFMRGAIFVFLGVPEGTEFGIDMKLWNTGERFRGVKMIPPGLHFIFYSNVDKLGSVAPRTGFYHNFTEGEMLVRKWDSVNEDISLDYVTEEEIDSLRNSLHVLDKFLGPYPYDILRKWQTLTSHITVELVNKLEPESGLVKSSLELVPNGGGNESYGKLEINTQHCKRGRINSQDDKEDDILPDLIPVNGTQLRLTKLPHQMYPDGATSSQITQCHMDSTYALEVMLKTYKTHISIIGEFQFCYMCFLVGHSLDAFEHWKKIFGLLCSCELAIKKFREIYDVFMTIVVTQIQEIPEAFLADIVSNNNYVYTKLRSFFRTVMESDMDGRFKTKAEKLKHTLAEVHNWDFNHLLSDDEDDAPVIVDLSEIHTPQNTNE